MTVRRVAIALAAANTLLLAVAFASLILSLDAPVGDGSWGFRGFGLLNGIVFTAVGAIVVIRRPENAIGRLLLGGGVFWSVTELAFEYSAFAIVGRPSSLAGGVAAAWLCSWLWTVCVGVYPILLALFPDGRLSTAARRVVTIAAIVMTGLLALQFAVRPGPLQLAAFIDNPFTPLPPAVVDILGGSALAITFPMAIAVVAMLVQRYRRSTAIAREQLKWLVYAALPLLLLGPLSSFVPGKPIQVASAVAQLALPTGIAIAVMRYRLYDIDVLINRTIVYGATTAVIAVAFFGGLIVLQAILSPITSGSEVAVAISTLASVALFQPLRARVQRTVDRRFYRSRYDAARTLDDFTVRLRDQVALEAVRADLLEAVRGTVQPSYASLWLRPE